MQHVATEMFCEQIYICLNEVKHADPIKTMEFPVVRKITDTEADRQIDTQRSFQPLSQALPFEHAHSD